MKKCMTLIVSALGLVFAASLFSAGANAKPLIDLDKCVVLPNEGNYVYYPGQIDCYTGEYVSVEGNAGNNIGTSPQERQPKATLTKQERVHKTAWNRFVRNKRNAVQATLNAKQALRDRNWRAARDYTRQAIEYGKAAHGYYQQWLASAP